MSLCEPKILNTYIKELNLDVSGLNYGNRSLLHYASFRTSDLKVHDFLLSLGTDLEIKDAELGATPLHFACREKNYPVIKYLLEKGANPNATDNVGDTPAHWACKVLDSEVIKILIKYHGNLDTSNNSGQTPLHYACETKNLKLLTTLLNASDLVNKPDDNGNTPLHTMYMKKIMLLGWRGHY